MKTIKTTLLVLATIFISAEASGEPTPSAWEYTETEDTLTGQATRLACVRSTRDSRVNLPFPYNSTRHAILCVRNHPQHGIDILLSTLGNSQILCRSRACSVRVRFDDAEVLSVTANPPSDGSTEIVFLASWVLREIRNSDAMRVQVEFYNHGNHTFVFNTTGLELEE